jgi:beta-lactamase superfamily II metal-dependent hydrolase
VEISGFRFLFAGDANGKERDEPGPGTSGHVEANLLALEQAHPGILKADVLKVPHHGSETASTQEFINKVDPAFAIISASTQHHLPRDTVVHRYENPLRVILRTDVIPAANTDHILCFRQDNGKLDCNYERVLVE